MRKKQINVESSPKIAVAYARYSSNNQREESIDAQLRAIREYCEKNNIILLECFVDEALTGQNDDRKNFQRMINAIFRNHIKVDTILVHKFNRFARNKFDSAIHKKRLKDIGVRVISVTQPIENTPEGAMLETIIEAMDEYYSANLALEVKKGLKENALNGRHTGGTVAFGFSINEEGKYIPNESAEIVKRIFREYAAEIPKTEICERLNREGIKNGRGNTFNVRSLYDMLRNEKYIGNYIYTLGNETIRLDGIIQPIIDRDLWVRVQKLCNQPVKARMRHQKARYFLTGKIVCGICGASFCGAGSKRMRNGDLYYYYKCNGKTKHKNGCCNPSLNKLWFETKVLRAVVNAVMDENRLKEIARLTFDELQALKKSPAETLKKLQKEYAEIKQKQSRLAVLFVDGNFDKEMLDAQNKALASRKFEIENEIEKQKAAAEADGVTEQEIFDYVFNYIEKLKKDNSSNNDEFMRSVFNAFVEKIVVNEKSITVFLNADFSILADGDNRKFAGALHHLPAYKFETFIPRKSSHFGRNE